MVTYMADPQVLNYATQREAGRSSGLASCGWPKFCSLNKEGIAMEGRRGFTLIELAVVLVIIGILMGAVLRGQELIKSAKEKKFFTKLRYIASAQFTYLDRIGRYAGDTDDDGIIDNNNTAWDELKQQQIVQDNDRRHIFNGQFNFGGGIAPYGNYNYIRATRVPAWVAQSIDNKIDDGEPGSGNVRWSTSDNPNGQATYPTDPNWAAYLYWWFDR